MQMEIMGRVTKYYSEHKDGNVIATVIVSVENTISIVHIIIMYARNNISIIYENPRRNKYFTK